MNALKSSVAPIPSNIRAELTGIPTAIAAAITNPVIIYSLVQEFATAVPAWYSNLRPEAQSWILSIGPAVLGIQPALASLQSVIDAEIATGVVTATVTGNVTATVTLQSCYSNSTTSGRMVTSVVNVNVTTSLTGSKSWITSTAATGSAETTVGAEQTATSSSTAAAPRQSAGLAAGVLGAVGVLGLMAAL